LIQSIKYSLVLLFILFCLGLSAQRSVHFYEDNFDKALAIAKIEGKDVFIDTWASWCVACKKQEKVFEDKLVINFLNKNFINLRINMDNAILGKKMNLEYEVIFLPTLIILNDKGEVKVKTENYLSAEQLLSFLKYGKSKDAQAVQNTLNTRPFTKEEKKPDKKVIRDTTVVVDIEE